MFTWQTAGFGAVLLLNVINLLFCSNAVQYNCNVLLGVIHAVAFATDWLLAARATPVAVSWAGRMCVQPAPGVALAVARRLRHACSGPPLWPAALARTIHTHTHGTRRTPRHTHATRRFVPLRYIQWLHTTPTMILLMGMMSDRGPGAMAAAVGADLAMVLTGLAASWTDGPLQVRRRRLRRGGWTLGKQLPVVRRAQPTAQHTLHAACTPLA